MDIHGSVIADASPEHNFHPCFATPLEDDDVIIQSETHVSFHFPLTILSQQSSFFSTMSSLPQPKTGHLPNIHPPESDTQGLKILLSILTLFKDIPPAAIPEPDKEDELIFQRWPEACEIADRWDIPAPLQLTIDSAEMLLCDSPYQRVALYCLIPSESLARIASKSLPSFNPDDIPLDVLRVLKACAPAYLARLSIHRDHITRKIRFRQALEINQPMIDGLMVFASSCVISRCRAFTRSNGDFRVVRMRAAKGVYEAFGLKRGWWEVQTLLPNVYFLLGCKVVVSRMSLSKSAATLAHEDQPWRKCSELVDFRKSLKAKVGSGAERAVSSVGCRSLNRGDYSVLYCDHPLKTKESELDRITAALVRRTVCLPPGMSELRKTEEVEECRIFAGAVLGHYAKSTLDRPNKPISEDVHQAWERLWTIRYWKLTPTEKTAWEEYVVTSMSMSEEEKEAWEADGCPSAALTKYSSFVVPIPEG